MGEVVFYLVVAIVISLAIVITIVGIYAVAG